MESQGINREAQEPARRRLRVVVLAQTPPPYGGQAVMVQLLLDGSYRHASLLHVRMNFSREVSEMRRFQIRKLWHLGALVARLLAIRVSQRAEVLYFPPSGPTPLPVARDLALLLATRWMFSRTVLHFYASGISDLYGRMPGWLRWLYRRAYFGADAAIRLGVSTPDDPALFKARRAFIVPTAATDSCVGPPAMRSRLAPPIVLFVGVLRESKGVLVLLEAAAQLAAAKLAFQVNFVGAFESADFESELEQRVARLGLSKHVALLGVLIGDEKTKAFKDAAVFCFPTFFDSEAMPVAVVEAMMFGLPVVASRWRGVADLVIDAETGFLVEPRDAAAIAHRLKLLLNDRDLAARMGRQGRLRYEAEYTVERFRARMDSVFQYLNASEA